MKKKLTCIVLIITLLVATAPCAFAADANATQAANRLYTLGLFSGTGKNADGTPIFELDRMPTRQEAITMLVRLLGKEDEANAGSWTTPFTDVDAWALPYVGYAYTQGLTSGTGATTFGGNETVTAAQYLTFVLRALGYRSGTDFAWDSAWVLSDTVGMTNGEYSAASRFTRGDVVKTSCNALGIPARGTAATLLSTLVSSGSVSIANVEAAGLSNALSVTGVREQLTSEQVSAKCSPAVFYIEVYLRQVDYPEYPVASGSGFFITADGVAVTNYHVLVDSKYATVTTTDGNVYEISSVLYADEDRDLAVVRISPDALSGDDATTFPYLPILPSSAVASGAVCYAIGSPLGLQNTISNGIVSSTARTFDGLSYIQTTAPISSGSSGGALLNAYGEAVGITCAYFVEGQNLNLAVPMDEVLTMDLTQAGASFEEEFSRTSATVPPRITASVTSVSLAAGDEKKIKITVDDTEGEYYLFYDTSEEGYVYCEWGDWVSENSLYLTITALKMGTVTVYVTTDVSADLSYAAAIEVSIVSQEVGYDEYARVPDFGAYAGVAPYLSGTADDGSLSYFYRISDMSDEGVTMSTDYGSLLEEWGFSWEEAVYDNSDGTYYEVYLDSRETRAVLFGTCTVDGYACLCVMILVLD